MTIRLNYLVNLILLQQNIALTSTIIDRGTIQEHSNDRGTMEIEN